MFPLNNRIFLAIYSIIAIIVQQEKNEPSRLLRGKEFKLIGKKRDLDRRILRKSNGLDKAKESV